MSSAFRMSPSTNRKSPGACAECSQARFRSEPGLQRLSKSVTSLPWRIIRSARLLPTNPAPPVIRTRLPCMADLPFNPSLGRTIIAAPPLRAPNGLDHSRHIPAAPPEDVGAPHDKAGHVPGGQLTVEW